VNPIRPPLTPPVPPQPERAAAARPELSGAQALFALARGQAAAQPQAAPAVSPAPAPAAPSPSRAAAPSAEPPSRLLRPGSLLDIRV